MLRLDLLFAAAALSCLRGIALDDLIDDEPDGAHRRVVAGNGIRDLRKIAVGA